MIETKRLILRTWQDQDLITFTEMNQGIDPSGGPVAGPHSFYRGGTLLVYDDETRHAIKQLQGKIDEHKVQLLWESALATSWQHAPVWVHGDVSAGNLLVKDGKLTAVIDFGQMAIGDPACDLAIAWTLFNNNSREIFQTKLNVGQDTWLRAKAWTLWITKRIL